MYSSLGILICVFLVWRGDSAIAGTRPVKKCTRGSPFEISMNIILESLFKANLIPPGDVLDVGCNYGNTACMFSCWDPDRTVHCVEPTVTLFNKMTCRSKKVLKYNMGVSDAPGFIDIASTDNVHGFKGLYKIASSGVEVTTIDNFFRNKSQSIPGFLHIDVEGFELLALRGASAVIDQYKPFFTFELHVNTNKSFTRELTAYAESKGYTLFLVNEGCGKLIDCRNVLAIPHNIVRKVCHSPTFELALRTSTCLHITADTVLSVYNNSLSKTHFWGKKTRFPRIKEEW